MIFSLPQDVNEIIYDFLLFSNCHRKYFCISKISTNNINLSQTIKKYNLFKERINMVKEDKNEHIKHIREDNDIFKLWNNYHLHKWYNITNYKYLWKKGDYVDVYDFVKGWCPAIIIDAYIEKKKQFQNLELTIDYFRIYKISFMGWDDKYIEKVEIDKIAPLGKYTYTPMIHYDNFYKDLSGNKCFWVLCKKENTPYWNMCKIIQMIKEEDCIKILSNADDIFKITKNNIHNTIRHITEATTFFSIETEYCFFKRREFKF